MEVQLRDYRIRPGHWVDWIAGWLAAVVPLRRATGFTVVGAWADRQHDRFIWLLGYEGPDGFVAADERYYNSHQRRSLDPDPARLSERLPTSWCKPSCDSLARW